MSLNPALEGRGRQSSVWLRPAWSTELILWKPGLHKKKPCLKKQTKDVKRCYIYNRREAFFFQLCDRHFSIHTTIPSDISATNSLETCYYWGRHMPRQFLWIKCGMLVWKTSLLNLLQLQILYEKVYPTFHKINPWELQMSYEYIFHF